MFSSYPGIFALLTTVVSALNPIVDLSYTSYRGYVNASNGVTSWMGMRYAAPPLGNLRFAAPQDPPTASGVQDATKHAPYCLGVGVTSYNSSVTNEDCLFLDVYAPSNATNTSALPVYFFIQGGGFAQDANANFNGRGLVAASGYNIVVVTFNYRVGAYGFISGSEIDSPNNGLKDQRKAMQWVQKHIAAFGGNPAHVVIGGDSAGAASVSLQLSAYGGRNDNLFHGAAAESVSFATMLTVKESQYLYDALVKATGCGPRHSNTLSCLRSLTADQLQHNVTSIPYPAQHVPPLYSWDPVIDGDLVQDYTYRAFNQGKFIHVPTIFGDDTNGGTIFVPKWTNSLQQSDNFLTQQFPYLTQAQLDRLNQLYPNPNLTFANAGAYWRQASNVYGEMRYMCPGIFLNRVYSNRSVPTWNYLYNVQDPAQVANGLGVPHTVEINVIWGPGNVGSAMIPASYLSGGSNSQIVPVIQAYWTSFIRAFDPNVYRLSGTPTWEEYNTQQWDRFQFDTPVSASAMQTIDNGLKQRCEYIWSIGQPYGQQQIAGAANMTATPTTITTKATTTSKPFTSGSNKGYTSLTRYLFSLVWGSVIFQCLISCG